MAEYRLGEIESKFAEIIWENQPLTSRQLADLALERLCWKRTTTYTVLKKLCSRGFFKNEQSIVTALISRQDFYARQSRRFVDESFDGSLPAFLAAFASGGKLTARDLEDIRRLLAEFDKEGST